MLKDMPDQDAQVILQQIRSGFDAAKVLKSVKDGDLLLQMAVVPETRFRYEFPYRKEMPEYGIANNLYLNSLLHESATLSSNFENADLPNHEATSLSTQLTSEEYQSYLKPFHAAKVVETWLSDVKISSWTTVCDDDMLMRDLLAEFFLCEYHFTAAFQKDLFLEDMAAHRSDFCSSLLVNVVLAYSCVCYRRFANRVEYWNPRTMTYRFIAEAKRIWELEASVAHITTVQAGILFTVFHNLCALDEIGKIYRIQAVALAHKLGLFDKNDNGQDDRIQRGRTFTAWTLYNWETLTAFSFMNPPLLTSPPGWTLPDPREDPQWYGEIWVKYPLNHRLSPSYFGYTFQARCQFRIVMNEFCVTAYSKHSGWNLDHAYSFGERLQEWVDGLPGPLQPKMIVLPGHLQLHICYHHLLLTMYETLVDTETTQSPDPKQIVAVAKANLQTLVRLYYLRHGFETMDLFIVIPLMLTAYDCIDALGIATHETEIEVLRSTLILMAHGLYNQRRNHYLAVALFRVVRGRMRAQEVGILRGTLVLDAGGTDAKEELVQAVRSQWPVSIVKNIEDVKSHVLTNAVKNYAHLNTD